jgi:hypothetical protein
MYQDQTQVDEIIERLLDVRNGKPGKQVQLAENEIRMLCLSAKEIFMSQPNLLELEAPIKICGMLHMPLAVWQNRVPFVRIGMCLTDHAPRYLDR